MSPAAGTGRLAARVERARAGRRRRRAGLPSSARVFGIGLSRTGTTSLAAALEQLGLVAVHFPADPDTRARVLGFLERPAPSLTLPLLDSVDAATDTPVCVTFEALDAAYPGSRFVLTRRPKDGWLASCRRYWAEGVEPFMREHPGDPWTAYLEAISRELYDCAAFDPRRFSSAFDRYHDRVGRHFRDRGADLLTYDLCAGAGWEPLCSFLGLPVPARDFPRLGAPATAGAPGAGDAHGGSDAGRR